MQYSECSEDATKRERETGGGEGRGGGRGGGRERGREGEREIEHFRVSGGHFESSHIYCTVGLQYSHVTVDSAVVCMMTRCRGSVCSEQCGL